MSALAPILEGFFTERLIGQRQASPHTVASYRDAFRLLLAFVQRRVGKAPSTLALEDLDAVVIGAFLDHLEAERHNSVRTRNNRLAAIHSLFAYAALRHPEHAALIQRVLAIPAKRTDRQLVAFLADDEVDALLAAPDRDTWVGRRDHALLLVAVQTGLRVSELTSLTRADIELGTGAEFDVAARERGELRDAQSGLDGDEQQRVVATTDPGAAIRRCEDGVDLVVGEERDELSVRPLGGYGKHPLDQRRVLGMAHRRVGKQRVDRGQAVVAGADTVVTLGFQVIEEGPDHHGVEVLEAELGRRFAGAPLGEAEEQPERVPIGGHGVGAGSALADEPLSEEALHDRSERAHCGRPVAASRRAATRPSSSGAADRYQ